MPSERKNLNNSNQIPDTNAERVWRKSKPCDGTLVEEYLRSRGITNPPPDCLRFHQKLRHGPSKKDFPCMVAQVSNGVTGARMGIYRTFLAPDGAAKARVDPPDLFLGPYGGGAVWLSDLDPGKPLLVGEGIESCLAAMQATNIPTLAALTPTGLRKLSFHPDFRDIIIIFPAGQGSAANDVNLAALRWIAEGRKVRIAKLPNPNFDFCELLAGKNAIGTNHGLDTDPGEDGIRKIIESAVEATVSQLSPENRSAERSRSSAPPPEGGIADESQASCRDDEDADDLSDTDVLLGIVKKGRLFHTADGRAYARIPIGDHDETWAIRSSGFRKLLNHQFYQSKRCLPSAKDFDTALDTLEAQATYDGSEEKVHLRVAELNDRIYLDLCNSKWQVIELDKSGWRVIDNPPVNFRRAPGMAQLPIPYRGGSIKRLHWFVNVSDEHFVLLVSAVLHYFRTHGSYPIVAFIGEQGTAKSTTTRTVRNLVDPNASPLRALPRELRDLAIAANNGHLLAFDNISGISAQMSDALCRLSTGGGYSIRQLYKDEDEMVFDGKRPILLNGIEDMIDKPDLADRAIFIELELITAEMRRTEVELGSEFEKAWPEILGALLDGVVHGLSKLPNVQLSHLPRMADFAKWAAACETAFWPSGTFAAAYDKNRDHAAVVVLEGDLVSVELRKMIEARTEQTEWTGTATELLAELESEAEESIPRKRHWPDTARAFSGKLRRAAPFLRKVGIKIEFSREGHKRDRIIHISWEKSTNSSSAPPAPSADPERN